MGITSNSENRRLSEPVVRKAIATSDCIIDAIGAPFLISGSEASLTAVYPDMKAAILARYRLATDAIECDYCSIYAAK